MHYLARLNDNPILWLLLLLALSVGGTLVFVVLTSITI